MERINSSQILTSTLHISNLNLDKGINETGAFCVYTAAGFEAGVIAWCHGVQVVDDRPVFETRCALLSCSPVVVWALFVGQRVFNIFRYLFTFRWIPFQKRSISRYFGAGWLSGFSVIGSLTQAGEICHLSNFCFFQ